MFESKSDMYQKRVDKRYMEIARKYSLHVIDTAPSPKEVHAEVMRKFDGFDINSA